MLVSISVFSLPTLLSLHAQVPTITGHHFLVQNMHNLDEIPLVYDQLRALTREDHVVFPRAISGLKWTWRINVGKVEEGGDAC